MQLRLDLLSCLVPLIPGPEPGADKALIDGGAPVDDESSIGAGQGERGLKLLLIGLHIVEVRVLRTLGEAEDDALVLLRRQFLWLRSNIRNKGSR